MHRDILVSRDASALTGSVSVDLGFPPAAIDLPSNLRDSTTLKQFTQELRLASTSAGPFQWVFGGFYAHVDRDYEQRLPTPGYDAFVDAAFGAGTSAAVDNGFGLVDNPYHSDLPYTDTQKALFGEASYKFSQFKLTAGGRWYDFHEKRRFHSGGLFSNDDDRTDTTKSNGISPRGIVSWEPNRNFSVNLQAAKGFRLGGVNDPLNIPLCSGSDIQTFGGFQTYKDETLWNYEAGFKYSKHGVTFNAAAFYNDIKNLQVTLDAGSCSSRIVFNVPKAHAEGIEAELSVHPLVGLDLSFAGSLLNSKFGSSVISNGAVVEGIREGNRLPTVPKYQFAATANYTSRFNSNSDWFVNASVMRIGNRYTQPSDQEPAGTINLTFFDPATGSSGVVPTPLGTFSLPPYTLVNASLGLRWDSGLELVAYVKNIFDVDPKLSLDRERGLRARIGYEVGQPRTIGLTARYSFGGRNAPPPPPPPPPPLLRRLRKRLRRRHRLPLHRRRRHRSNGANAADRAGMNSEVTRRSLLIGAGGAAISPALATTYKARHERPCRGDRRGRLRRVDGAPPFASRPPRHARRRMGPGSQPRVIGWRIAPYPGSLRQGRHLYAHGEGILPAVEGP